MEKHLKKLPEEILSLIYLSRNIAEASGSNAYLIGGFVRDLIMGVKNLDLDIAIEGDGIKFADSLAQHLKAKIVKHKRFGTATVMVKPHLKIDIASTRREFYPEPACLPVVSNGSLKDDLFRRDFTINTLAIRITGRNFGILLDLFKGKTDIEHKNIRILHHLSFVDDPTRILRAIRFEQRYDFRIEPQTLKCLKEAVELKMLSIVEPQRLRDEIVLILKEKYPWKQIKRLKELVGLGFISPLLRVNQKTQLLFAGVAGQLEWFKNKFSLHRQLDTWLIYFMALLDTLNSEQAQGICNRFVLRKGELKRIASYMKLRSKAVLLLSRKDIKPSSVYHLLEPLSYEVIILLKAKANNKTVQKHIEDFFHIYNGTDISVSGHDLKEMGMAPGPHYQRILRQLLNAKLNGEVRNEKDEMELARRLRGLK